MNRHIYIIGKTAALLLSLGFAVSCGKPQPTDEEQGAQMLTEARTLYAQGQYAPARDTIVSMRRRFPLAIEARKAAILLMDSLELQLAEDDTLKQEFFRRKLEHDIQGLGNRD